MKAVVKSILFIIVSFNLISCMIQEPISVVAPENNKTYEIEYLFEHEGCKMYRFKDGVSYIYFSNCNNDVTRVVNDSVQIRVVDKIEVKKDKK